LRSENPAERLFLIQSAVNRVSDYPSVCILRKVRAVKGFECGCSQYSGDIGERVAGGNGFKHPLMVGT